MVMGVYKNSNYFYLCSLGVRDNIFCYNGCVRNTYYRTVFLTENSTTFRDVVGINLVKSCIENVFKYNDIFGKKKCYNKSGNTTTENTDGSDEIVG